MVHTDVTQFTDVRSDETLVPELPWSVNYHDTNQLARVIPGNTNPSIIQDSPRKFKQSVLIINYLSSLLRQITAALIQDFLLLMPAAFEAADTKKFVTALVKQKINYHE